MTSFFFTFLKNILNGKTQPFVCAWLILADFSSHGEAAPVRERRRFGFSALIRARADAAVRLQRLLLNSLYAQYYKVLSPGTIPVRALREHIRFFVA